MLITRPEESYRLWCVVVLRSRNLVNEKALVQWGLLRHGNLNNKFLSAFSIFIVPFCVKFLTTALHIKPFNSF